MKKLLILTLMFGAIAIAVPVAEAKTSGSEAILQPQLWEGQPRRNRRWNNRRTRVVTSTRIRWVGGYRYRETIRTTYFANGRTRTVIVSRVRLGGRRNY